MVLRISRMRLSFACPLCDAAGTEDAVYVGKQIPCKHCGTHFAIPDGETSEPDVYALEEPAVPSTRGIADTQGQHAVIADFRGREID